MQTIEKEQVKTEAATQKIRKVKVGDFGNGRYSPAMSELFKDSQRLLGFTDTQAHATAEQAGKDAGQWLSQNKAMLKFGKVGGKDAKMSLREVVNATKGTATWALCVGSVCSQLDECRKAGLKIVNVTMTDNIMLMINDFASRIEAE